MFSLRCLNVDVGGIGEPCLSSHPSRKSSEFWMADTDLVGAGAIIVVGATSPKRSGERCESDCFPAEPGGGSGDIFRTCKRVFGGVVGLSEDSMNVWVRYASP